MTTQQNKWCTIVTLADRIKRSDQESDPYEEIKIPDADEKEIPQSRRPPVPSKPPRPPVPSKPTRKPRVTPWEPPQCPICLEIPSIPTLLKTQCDCTIPRWYCLTCLRDFLEMHKKPETHKKKKCPLCRKEMRIE